MKTLTLKKAVALTALTLTPALALTSSAQAAPSHRAPITTRNHQAPTWSNSNNWRNQPPRAQASRYVPQYNQPRYNDYRNNGRFDSGRDTNRGRNQNNGNDTGKIIGAGIVGAILGAVLSR